MYRSVLKCSKNNNLCTLVIWQIGNVAASLHSPQLPRVCRSHVTSWVCSGHQQPYPTGYPFVVTSALRAFADNVPQQQATCLASCVSGSWHCLLLLLLRQGLEQLLQANRSWADFFFLGIFFFLPYTQAFFWNSQGCSDIALIHS